MIVRQVEATEADNSELRRQIAELGKEITRMLHLLDQLKNRL